MLTQTGELQAHLGEAASAEASFRAALELTPQYAAAMYGMALSQRDQKRWPEAEQSLRQPLGPQYGHVLRGQGLAHAQLQNGRALRKEEKLDEALLKYKASRDNDPRMLAALNNHAVLLHRQGEYESAVAEFKQAVQLTRAALSCG